MDEAKLNHRELFKLKVRQTISLHKILENDFRKPSATEDSRPTLEASNNPGETKKNRFSMVKNPLGHSGRRRPSVDKKHTFKELSDMRRSDSNKLEINSNALVGESHQGQQFTKYMNELGIDHRSLPINQAQAFLKRVAEIDKIRKDGHTSTSLREIKTEIAKTVLQSSYNHYKMTKEEEFQKEVQDAVSGQRHKKTVNELKDKNKIEEGKKSIFRLAQNNEKFFYERSENNVDIFKYSDYAHDLVMAEMMRTMLVADTLPEHRLTHLNHSNMPKVSKALKRLLYGVETEMESIQLEKDRYSRVTGILPEDLKDDRQHFKRVLKRSRFKAALLSSSAPPKAKEVRIDNLARLNEELTDMRENWTKR